MSIIQSSLIPATGGDFTVDQSLRFNDDDSSYLSWTPTSAGNRKTMTFSFWSKRGDLGQQRIFGSSSDNYIAWSGSDQIELNLRNGGSSSNAFVITTAKYRDFSAWYHIVVAIDTTQSTAANRVKIYVNGEQETSLGTATYPSQNNDINNFNRNTPQFIGRFLSGSYLDGYLAEVNFIDGSAKAPADFGETGTYGEWKPKAYSSTYGTNGYYLPFKQDNTVEGFSAVAYSGNSSIQLINGFGYSPDLVWIKNRDQAASSNTGNIEVLDAVRGNKKLLRLNSTGNEITEENAWGFDSFTRDGLKFLNGGYYEDVNNNTKNYIAWSWDMGSSYGNQFVLAPSGNAKHSNAQKKFGATSMLFDGTGDRVSINPTSSTDSYFNFGSLDFTLETWVRFNSVSGNQTLIDIRGNHGNYIQLATTNANFYVFGAGVTDFASSASIAINTWYHIAIVRHNGTIAMYQDGVNVGQDTTTGDVGGNDYAVTLGMYRKADGSAEGEALNGYMDEVRISNKARYISGFTTPTTIFTTDEKTLLLVHSNEANNSTTFVDDAGATINTLGSITSNVSANTAYGQSIVSWTGDNGGATIGHGLSSAPQMIILKERGVDDYWYTYHVSVGNTKTLNLAGTEIETSANFWGNTTPTTNTFTVGGSTNTNNSAGIVAYCWHSVVGYSKFSSYTGNGNATGPSVTTGFAPAFLLIKNTGSAHGWQIYDNTRNPANPVNNMLIANTGAAEIVNSSDYKVDFTSTGFQVKTADAWLNENNTKMIYMAFADKREFSYWLDQSGNNNDWTSNNLTESDVMVDSPSNNFPTMNPLFGTNQAVLSEANLKATYGSGYCGNYSTMTASSGKWYAEYLVTRQVGHFVGVWSSLFQGEANPQNNANKVTYLLEDGRKVIGTTFSSYGSALAVGDILSIKLDQDNHVINFAKNGTFIGDIALSGTVVGTLDLTIGGAGRNDTGIWNFGQDSSFAGNKTAQGNQDGNDIGDFYYTPPTGFLALCTSNLPDVAVIPSENFNTVLYTGTGNTNNPQTVGFQPDFTWIKQRSGADYHALQNSVTGNTKILASNGTFVEWTITDALTSWTSTGFTLGADASGFVNENSGTYVAWNWKANGSGSTNTNGSINTTVSANVNAGFSIVKYTAESDGADTVGHGLSKAPEIVFWKARNKVEDWLVTSTLFSNSARNFIKLNTTAAVVDYGSDAYAFTASTIRAATRLDDADNYIAYAFHSVDGYSKVGSYTGNGSADGTFVYTGFRPAYVMVKRTDAANYWLVLDDTRREYNPNFTSLYPNLSSAEDNFGNGTGIDFLSNGFKHRDNAASTNASGGTYIYLAFAETPFKYSNGK